MKLFYAIRILAQVASALLSQNERKVAYLLYLWSDLSGQNFQMETPSTKSPGIPNRKEPKSPGSAGAAGASGGGASGAG